jgi:hypothetical protein
MPDMLKLQYMLSIYGTTEAIALKFIEHWFLFTWFMPVAVTRQANFFVACCAGNSRAVEISNLLLNKWADANV